MARGFASTLGMGTLGMGTLGTAMGEADLQGHDLTLRPNAPLYVCELPDSPAPIMASAAAAATASARGGAAPTPAASAVAGSAPSAQGPGAGAAAAGQAAGAGGSSGAAAAAAGAGGSVGASTTANPATQSTLAPGEATPAGDSSSGSALQQGQQQQAQAPTRDSSAHGKAPGGPGAQAAALSFLRPGASMHAAAIASIQVGWPRTHGYTLGLPCLAHSTWTTWQSLACPVPVLD